MKDLTTSMEMSEKFDKEHEEAEKKASEEVDAKKEGKQSIGGAAGAAAEPRKSPSLSQGAAATTSGPSADEQRRPSAAPQEDEIPMPSMPDPRFSVSTPSGTASSTATPPLPPRSPQPDSTATGTVPSEAPPLYDPAQAKDVPPEKPPRPAGSSTDAPPAYNPYTQERPSGVPTRLAITEAAEDSPEKRGRDQAAGVTEKEKELRAKEKKKGLTKEQREELQRYEEERQRIRKERVDTLASKLIDRVSVWTETDKGKLTTDAFREKTRLEAENMKMESFGIEILHSIGHVYVTKASNYLKSQGLFGSAGGFFGRLKEKGNMVKDVWGTISSALDAQTTMEQMAKAEEAGGDAWTDEARADYERRVTGKILAAAWRGSKFEIQGVLRDVCDQVLEDRKVSKSKRTERAHALLIIGGILKDAKRTAEEENENMVFEQLMADAAKKKEKEEGEKKHHHHHAHKGESENGNGNGKKHFPFRTKEKTGT